MSSKNKLFWNRVGHIEIEESDHTYTPYRGLDFKFDVDINGRSYANFTVGICGLSRDVINQIITWPKPDNYKNPRHIKVYAGYEDGGESLIAYGGIFSAIPTTPPDVWLNIEACKFLELRRPIENVEPSKQEKFSAIFSNVAKLCGMKAGSLSDVTTVDTSKKYDFEYTGSYEMLPQKFAEAFDVIVYDKGDHLLVCDKKMEYSTPKNCKTVDREHGLLSLGSIAYNRASVTTWLNDYYDFHDWIELKSERISQADSEYYVTNIRHTGHLRGEDWKTTLTMIRHQNATN